MNTDQEYLDNMKVSLGKMAIITGIGLLLMAIIAPIANFNIFPRLIVTSDPEATANNIISSIGLFRLGILCFLIVAILDIIVAWGLYILLKPINKNISLLIAWFRIVYAAILIFSLNNLFNVLQLLNGSDILKVFQTEQLYAQVMILYNSFNSGWELGMIVFSIHLVGLGFLMIKAKYIPKLIAILIIIAGFGYLIDGIGKTLSSNYNIEIAMFTFAGEVVIILWLFWKGIKGFNHIDIGKS